MNEKKKRNWLTIAGLIALIIVLCACVELLFMGLGMVIPNSGQAAQGSQPPAQSQQVQPSAGTEAPAFCPFCGERLPSFFQWGQYCPWCGEQVDP